MFERYTEAARRVIFFARYEALSAGARHIAVEHIVLGIFRQSPGLAERMLPEGTNADTVRQTIEAQVSPNEDCPSPRRDLPLSSAGKKVLAYAARESDQTGTWSIAPEHLLLGVMAEQQSSLDRFLVIPAERLSLLRSELRPEPVGQSFASARRWQVARPWVRGLRLILFLFFSLFIVQVAGKAAEHELLQSDRVMYLVALFVTGISLCGLTTVMRGRFWVTRLRARRVYYCTLAAFLIGSAILFLSVGSSR